MIKAEKEVNVYDEVPYPVTAYPQSHPDRLYVIGRFFGMEPKPVERCRVLELGCAGGGNVIPMAHSLPGSEFIGLDSSERQIDDGLKLIESVGLSNVALKCESLQEYDPESGAFDYVIAHGVYSWVKEEDRSRLLEICRESLNPDGIAYVSYNTYPGWKLRGMLREMLLYHTSKVEGYAEKVRQARALTELLVQSNSSPEDPYGIYLKKELEHMKRQSGSGVLHDLLEEECFPVYFDRFIGQAEEAGLKYLGESEFHTMLPENFKPEVKEVLGRLQEDIIATEQYMDFLRNRAFRQTLLCRREVELNRNVGSSVVKEFHVGSKLKPVSRRPDLQGEKIERFGTEDGGTHIETEHPLAKAFLCILSEAFPQTVPFEEGLKQALERVGDDGTGAASAPDRKDGPTEQLCGLLIEGYSRNVIELRSFRPAYETGRSARPKASRLARALAERGGRITNQIHQTLEVDFLSRKIIGLLDGEKSVEEIGDRLIAMFESGEIDLQQGGKKVEDAGTIRGVLRGNLPGSIDGLAQRAILIG